MKTLIHLFKGKIVDRIATELDNEDSNLNLEIWFTDGTKLTLKATFGKDLDISLDA